MPGLLFQCEDVPQRIVRGDVGVADYKSGFIGFDTGHHGRLTLDRLRAEDEAHAAFLGQSNGHFVIGNGLHDGGGQRDVHRDGGLFALPETDQGGFQTHPVGDALRTGIPGNQQILAESAGRFGKYVGHVQSLLVIVSDGRRHVCFVRIGRGFVRPPRHTAVDGDALTVEFRFVVGENALRTLCVKIP